MFKCDGVDILVEDEGDGNREVEDVEALGTERVGKNLDGVGDDEWGEGETKKTNQQWQENEVDV